MTALHSGEWIFVRLLSKLTIDDLVAFPTAVSRRLSRGAVNMSGGSTSRDRVGLWRVPQETRELGLEIF